MIALKIHALDWIVNLFLIFPAVICYWRGIWDLYSYYVYRGREPLNHWVTSIIGSTFILAYYVYPLLERHIHKLPEWIRPVVIRSNLYIWGLLSMAYWQGTWELLDFYLYQYGWQGGAIGLAISYPILVLTGTSRTIIFTPFATDVDWRDDVLDSSTVFQTKLKKDFRNLSVYTFDCLFTQFFINTISIVCWRSILMMISEIPFPEGLEDFICLGIGMFSTVLLFSLEIPLAILGRRLVPCGVSDSSNHHLDGNGILEKTKTGKKVFDEENRAGEVEDQSSVKTHLSSHTWTTRIGDLSTRGDQRSADENMKERVEKTSGKAISNVEFFQIFGDKNGKSSQKKLKKTENHFYTFNLNGLKSRLYEQAIFILVFIAEGFLWEGAWNLNSTYVISDLQIGGWVNHLLGSFILFIMGLTSDGGTCGCVKDDPVLGGFEAKGTAHLYPNKFVRLIVEEAVEEKLNSREKCQQTSTTVASVATEAGNVDRPRSTPLTL